jgi:hypothetical protein
MQDLDGEWIVLNNLGELERDEHAYDRAADLLAQAVAVARRLGDAESMAMSLHGLGDVALEVGDVEAAARHYRESLRITRTLKGRAQNVCFCLAGLASAAAASRETFNAGLLWGALEALEDELGMPLPTRARSRYEGRLLGLDEAAFAAAVQEGRELTLDAALEQAAID